MVHRLQGFTAYTCQLGMDKTVIKPRNIYLAPPDRHLLVKADGRILIGRGPTENRWRCWRIWK